MCGMVEINGCHVTPINTVVGASGWAPYLSRYRNRARVHACRYLMGTHMVLPVFPPSTPFSVDDIVWWSIVPIAGRLSPIIVAKRWIIWHGNHIYLIDWTNSSIIKNREISDFSSTAGRCEDSETVQFLEYHGYSASPAVHLVFAGFASFLPISRPSVMSDLVSLSIIFYSRHDLRCGCCVSGFWSGPGTLLTNDSSVIGSGEWNPRSVGALIVLQFCSE